MYLHKLMLILKIKFCIFYLLYWGWDLTGYGRGQQQRSNEGGPRFAQQ